MTTPADTAPDGPAPSRAPDAPADALMERLFESIAAAMDVFSVHVGDALGLYRALADDGPCASPDLAERTGTAERYVREWLEQQTVTGLLAVDDPAAPAAERRYLLPEPHEAVLVDPLSPLFLAPVARLVTAAFTQAPALLAAYRDGGGVPWAAFGPDMRTGQSDANRPFFMGELVPAFVSRAPGVDESLRAPGARIAEIGPGGGWAAIALAQAYPDATYEGFDLDGPSVELARANVAAPGLADRVRLNHQDAAAADLAGTFDLVCAFECIHDMSNPVAVLATMGRLVRPGGTVLVMDERCAEEFGAVGDLLERLLYGYSLMICLPDGMASQPSAGTGTVMRPSVLDAYAREAGFSGAQVLPLEHDLFRFYQLNP